MEFALTEDQIMFQASVQGYLADAAALEIVRKVAAGEAQHTATIAAGLKELGVGQILVPEIHDGLELGLLDAALVQEAVGAAAAPGDHLSMAMATIGIVAAADGAQQAEWLPKLGAGEMRIGIAVAEQVGARDGAGVVADGDRLNGKSLFALDTANATHILVGDTHGRLHLVDTSGDGVSRRALRTIDRTRDFAELTFSDAASVSLLGENQARTGAERMVQVGRLLLAADSLGACQTMLDKAVAYAQERKQFGRVIGSFQAVKHMCAEMAAQIEPARALVWHAAHAWDEGMEEADLMICLAKSHLAEVGTFVARTATEVHGGMGFTDLLGLHYWFKRINANRQLLGSPEIVRAEAARRQGWA